MQELLRLRLYNSLLNDTNIEEGVNRYVADNFSYILRQILNVNTSVLTGVENYYISPGYDGYTDNYEERFYLDYPEQYMERIGFRGQIDYREIGQNIPYEVIQRYNDARERLIGNIRTAISDSIRRENNRENYRENHSKYLFSSILTELSIFNNTVFNSDNILFDRVRADRSSEMPQVFLSHAFKDSLYAYALFLYFLDKGIWLYVDWMNQGPYTDGDRLKLSLFNELIGSNQLLFLRTPQSELSLKGNKSITQWCAWEIGNFYGQGCSCYRRCPYEQYIINLYSESNDSFNNMVFHGMQKLTDVKNRRLIGETIKHE